jgi:hypothetical protein
MNALLADMDGGSAPARSGWRGAELAPLELQAMRVIAQCAMTKQSLAGALGSRAARDAIAARRTQLIADAIRLPRSPSHGSWHALVPCSAELSWPVWSESNLPAAPRRIKSMSTPGMRQTHSALGLPQGRDQELNRLRDCLEMTG